MHEISLVQELVDLVTSRAQGRPVTRVVVRHAGTIPPDGLRETWTSVVAGGPLSSAVLDATEIERRLRCPCGLDGVLGHERRTGNCVDNLACLAGGRNKVLDDRGVDHFERI